MKIQFLGASDGVTASRHLVETADRRILLDCGLFQGWKLHRERQLAKPARTARTGRRGAEPRPPGPQRRAAAAGAEWLCRPHPRQRGGSVVMPAFAVGRAQALMLMLRRLKRAGGSRGARLVAGEREIKIFGEWVPVRAEVSQLAGFSAHADRSEPDAADALRIAIQRELDWPGHVPQFGQRVTADTAP